MIKTALAFILLLLGLCVIAAGFCIRR